LTTPGSCKNKFDNQMKLKTLETITNTNQQGI